jgi:hypothetical protein
MRKWTSENIYCCVFSHKRSLDLRLPHECTQSHVPFNKVVAFRFPGDFCGLKLTLVLRLFILQDFSQPHPSARVSSYVESIVSVRMRFCSIGAFLHYFLFDAAVHHGLSNKGMQLCSARSHTTAIGNAQPEVNPTVIIEFALNPKTIAQRFSDSCRHCDSEH